MYLTKILTTKDKFGCVCVCGGGGELSARTFKYITMFTWNIFHQQGSWYLLPKKNGILAEITVFFTG